ncbi:hypothetical protein GCM10010508_42820 [Streptomyces naganishii JCM 4654]|uniref:Uncharacterized protein n=1 Tax=Streptomyces naganishii JCM 4654 TaxID=1306179 RepID=A0A918Y5K8_9ACTN|nr:hypothetical protein GCM10010508_42820 [Streptomyces naganishii JCM 4654]
MLRRAGNGPVSTGATGPSTGSGGEEGPHTRGARRRLPRQAIKECERRLARCQAALDAGAAPAVATRIRIGVGWGTYNTLL